MTFPTMFVNTTLECVVCIVTPIDPSYSNFVFWCETQALMLRLRVRLSFCGLRLTQNRDSNVDVPDDYLFVVLETL